MSLKKVKLGQLIEKYGGLIQTGPFGSQLHESDYSEEGIPVVMPKDIIDGKISENSTAKISEDIYSRLQRHKLNIGDIVLPRRGNFNKRSVITEREEGWLCGTGCIKINVNPQVLDPQFFYYYISQSDFVDYIESQAIGSTMLNLSGSIVEGFEILLPPLEIQHCIAEILSRYDHLIENYQRQIGILEQMAQELYREWFVRMRCPYAQVSEDGGLPEGWENKPFKEFVQLKRGYDLTENNIVEGDFPVIASTSIKAYHNEYKVEPPCITTGRSGSLGTVLWVNRRAWPLNTALYVSDYKDNSPYFVYYRLCYSLFSGPVVTGV